MKLNQKFLLSLFLGLFCFAFPQAHADNSGSQPGVPPPTRTDDVAASMFRSSTSVEVIFYENADDVLVEVFTETGILVYHERGIANAQTRLRIDARSWKGAYVIRVSLDNAEKFFNVYF